MRKYERVRKEVKAFRYGVDENPLWFEHMSMWGETKFYGKDGFNISFKGKTIRGFKGDYITMNDFGELEAYSPEDFEREFVEIKADVRSN